MQHQVMDVNTSYGPDRAADAVLRSSDNKHFYVIGSLLRYASPVFMDMFILNHGPAVEENEIVDGYPVIALEEDSCTIRFLLDCLYPQVEEPQLTDVCLLRKVGKAAQKYTIDVVEGKLKKWMLNSELLSSEPFRIYAVAISLDWEHLATEAARQTLHIPLEDLPLIEELKDISGSDFYRFLEYRLRCGNSSDTKAEILLKLPNNSTEGSSEIPNLPPATTTDAPVDAPEPFGSSAIADLILRSSDSVDFFVISVLLRLSSPLFDGMFPLGYHEVKNGLPVVPIEEDSNVLRELLAFIYPHMNSDETNIQDFKMYKKVVRAARAQEMLAVEKKLRKQALVSPLIQSEPLRLHLLATALRWEDVAKAAALNTLSRPLQEMVFVEEMAHVTAADLDRLVKFRFRCGSWAWHALETHADFKKYGPSQWKNYWSKKGTQYKPICLEELYTKIRACPRASTINEIYTVELENLVKQSDMVFNGATSDFRCIMDCRNDIGNVIETAVSKVSLNKSKKSSGSGWLLRWSNSSIRPSVRG